jgi:hypothetical protein
MNFGGTNTKYNVPLTKIDLPDLGPGNTRKITPQYQMVGRFLKLKMVSRVIIP